MFVSDCLINKQNMPVTMRTHSELARERFQEENVYTNSSLEQRSTEESCLRVLEKVEACLTDLDDFPILNRLKTIPFLKKGLRDLSEGYECLDASRPWLVYWILHSLELLEEPLSEEEKSSIVKFLANCQDAEGGFAGGPGQLAHLAPTYAAVNSLVIIGTEVTRRAQLLSTVIMRMMLSGSLQSGGQGEDGGVAGQTEEQ